MAEQVTPLTRSPLSQESRQVIGQSTSVSGEAIRGANLLSPIVPSETDIRNLQVSKQNQTSLIELQSGIIDIRQDINKLNSGLISVSTLLQQDAVSEERNLRSQQESERRLVEEQIRLGKESDIERKIESAIVEPVERLAPKVQNLFGRILQSLGYLFGGWLTNQVIEYIKAEGEGNNKRLGEIKNNIIKNLGIAAGVLLTIKFGFNIIKSSLSNITSGIARLLGKTVATPFNVIKGLVTPNKPPGGVKPPGGGFGGAVKGLVGGAGNIVKGLGIPALTGTALTGLDIAQGEDPARAVAGTAGGMIASGAAFAVGSLAPIPGSGLVASAFAYGPGQDIGKEVYDNFFGKPESKTAKKPQTKISNTQQPKQELKPSQPLVLPSNTQQPKQELKPSSNTQQPKQELKPSQPLVLPSNTQQPKQELKPSQPLVLPSNAESLAQTKTESLKTSPQTEMMSESKMNLPNYSNTFNLSASNTFETSNLFSEKNSDGEAKANQEMLYQNKESEFDMSSLFKSSNANKFLESYDNLVSSESVSRKSVSVNPVQIRSIPGQVPKIGELPKPKPNVIYASSGSSQQQGAQMNQTVSNGTLTDVPLIRSSNPDNFYILYSYSCYNVVI